MQTDHKSNSSVRNGIAGVCSGVLTKSTVQPLDFLRTRLQVHDCVREDYKLLQTVTNIFKNEGISALYRGLSANLLGSGVNWGIYFFTYESIKSFLNDHTNSNKKLSSSHHFVAGALSGISAITVTNPIWCVKTRLQIQDKSSSTAYKGLFDCFTRIIKEEGILNLYRGLGPAYILVANPALQFTFYEKLKSLFIELHLYYDKNGNSDLGSTDFLVMGAMAKMMSSSTVYPMQLVRARLFQTEKSVVTTTNNGIGTGNVLIQNKYYGVTDCVKRIFLREGINGFYKGLSINLVKTVPSSALTFMFYENTMKILNQHW